MWSLRQCCGVTPLQVREQIGLLVFGFIKISRAYPEAQNVGSLPLQVWSCGCACSGANASEIMSFHRFRRNPISGVLSLQYAGVRHVFVHFEKGMLQGCFIIKVACIYMRPKCMYVWCALWSYACALHRETFVFLRGFTIVPQTTPNIETSSNGVYLDPAWLPVTSRYKC